MIDSSGQPIRGKIDPFKLQLDPLLTNVVTDNGIEIFREYLKDAIAMRLRHMQYAPVKITDECMNIIDRYINNTYISSFIKCCLRYYCDTKNHKLKNINTSCACCRSKDRHKSLQHAKQDCLVCCKHYMKIIKRQLTIYGDDKLLKKCYDIEISIDFVCNYICAILEGSLPRVLKCTTYNNIVVKDASISKLYTYNKSGEFYSLCQKQATYQSVLLTSATEIFCSDFILKKAIR